MRRLRETFHIAAPISHVWDLNVDARRLPEWEPTTLEVRDAPDRIDRVGATYTSVNRLMGRHLSGTFETIEVDAPHRLVQKFGMPGGGQAVVTVELAESGDGTDQTVSIDYELPFGFFTGIAEKLAAGSMERGFRLGNENFKALCEATVPQLA